MILVGWRRAGNFGFDKKKKVLSFFSVDEIDDTDIGANVSTNVSTNQSNLAG